MKPATTETADFDAPVRFIDYEFQMLGCFVCPLLNGEMDELTDEEETQLDAFIEREIDNGIGHWSIDDDVGFARCEVTGLMGDVVTLTFHRIFQ